jgi:tripartite-type tricarboxylate transporter receptor subunit TctC
MCIAPDIPTAQEAGVPGFDLSVWRGLWVPKETPKPIVVKLNAAIVDALADAPVQRRLATPVRTSDFEKNRPGWISSIQKAEVDKWWLIIKAAGIKAE